MRPPVKRNGARKPPALYRRAPRTGPRLNPAPYVASIREYTRPELLGKLNNIA